MPTTDPLETRTYPTAESAELFALEHDLPFDNQGSWCQECKAYHVGIAHSDAVNLIRQNEHNEELRTEELRKQDALKEENSDA